MEDARLFVGHSYGGGCALKEVWRLTKKNRVQKLPREFFFSFILSFSSSHNQLRQRWVFITYNSTIVGSLCGSHAIAVFIYYFVYEFSEEIEKRKPMSWAPEFDFSLAGRFSF